MVNTIKGSGSGVPPEQPLRTNTDTATKTQTQQATKQTGADSPAPTSAVKVAVDSVSLSSNAQAMKSLEEKVQKLPDVNEKRVAQIKAALDSGKYNVDDLVVADKLLNLDDLFG